MPTNRYNPNPDHRFDPEVSVLTPANYRAYAEAWEPDDRFRLEGMTALQRLDFVCLINDREVSLGSSHRHYLPPYVWETVSTSA